MSPEASTGSLIVPFLISYQVDCKLTSVTFALNNTVHPAIVLSNGVIITYTITPEKFGFQRAQLSQIQVHSVKESVSIIHQVLDNQPGPARDIVSLNAGAAIYAAGLTETLAGGITQAQAVLSQGAARNKLIEWINLTQSF